MLLTRTKASQEGTTLVVVLILVLVSTLLGLSAFEDSGITSKMVHNDQQREISFRAAESSSNQFVTNDTVNTLMGSGSSTLTDNTNLIDKTSTESNMQFDGVGISRGFSLGEGIPSLAPFKFTATTTVTLDGVNASSTIVRGAEQLAPKL